MIDINPTLHAVLSIFDKQVEHPQTRGPVKRGNPHGVILWPSNLGTYRKKDHPKEFLLENNRGLFGKQ